MMTFVQLILVFQATDAFLKKLNVNGQMLAIGVIATQPLVALLKMLAMFVHSSPN